MTIYLIIDILMNNRLSHFEQLCYDFSWTTCFSIIHTKNSITYILKSRIGKFQLLYYLDWKQLMNYSLLIKLDV